MKQCNNLLKYIVMIFEMIILMGAISGCGYNSKEETQTQITVEEYPSSLAYIVEAQVRDLDQQSIIIDYLDALELQEEEQLALGQILIGDPFYKIKIYRGDKLDEYSFLSCAGATGVRVNGEAYKTGSHDAYDFVKDYFAKNHEIHEIIKRKIF